MAGYQDILQCDKGQSLDTESPRCHEEYLLSDPDKVSKVTICWPISTVGTRFIDLDSESCKREFLETINGTCVILPGANNFKAVL